MFNFPYLRKNKPHIKLAWLVLCFLISMWHVMVEWGVIIIKGTQ